MTFTLCPVNAGALDKLPAKTDDKSGVGVHYVDAYIKPMNVKREDGIAVKCKRRGLKIVLTVKGKTRGRPAAAARATAPTRSRCSTRRCRRRPATPASRWRWPTVASI